jgi:hypothetical protein
MRSGVRLVQHGTVLSEIRTRPGPTHSVVDVIAATIHATGVGSRVALLGFAGGGLLAPLRAMGGNHRVDAVDLDASGHRLFRKLCRVWAGDVHFERAEVCGWLRRNPRRYDVIVEDLSIPSQDDVVKPAATWRELPPLVYQHLEPDGIAIFNLLPPEDGSWGQGLRQILGGEFAVRIVQFDEYENRLLIVAGQLPTARTLSIRLRSHLKRIRSRLATRIAVRSWSDRSDSAHEVST